MANEDNDPDRPSWCLGMVVANYLADAHFSDSDGSGYGGIRALLNARIVRISDHIGKSGMPGGPEPAAICNIRQVAGVGHFTGRPYGDGLPQGFIDWSFHSPEELDEAVTALLDKSYSVEDQISELSSCEGWWSRSALKVCLYHLLQRLCELPEGRLSDKMFDQLVAVEGRL